MQDTETPYHVEISNLNANMYEKKKDMLEKGIM